jgi:essential nuclear protein 1
MGKKKDKINTNFGHTQGFDEQINEGRVVKKKNKKLGDIKMRNEIDDEYIDPKTTQRILNAAQKQRLELAKEFGPTPGEASSRGLYDVKKAMKGSDSESDSEQMGDGRDEYNENDFFDDLKMNEDDERALQMFQNK